MAVLFSLNNRKVKAGRVIDDQAITLPLGVAAIAWTITVGDPNAPGDEDVTAWIERLTNGVWQEIGRFAALVSSTSTGLADVRGDGVRLSMVCMLGTTVSATVESA